MYIASADIKIEWNICLARSDFFQSRYYPRFTYEKWLSTYTDDENITQCNFHLPVLHLSQQLQDTCILIWYIVTLFSHKQWLFSYSCVTIKQIVKRELDKVITLLSETWSRSAILIWPLALLGNCIHPRLGSIASHYLHGRIVDCIGGGIIRPCNG